MTLQAVRFKTIEDIQEVVQKFISLGLIDKKSQNKLIGKEEIIHGKKVNSFKALNKNLLVSTNGSIYLVNDLKQYLAKTSDQELQDSNITFLTLANKTCNLTQLKNKASLFDEIETNFDTVYTLIRMNLNVFDSKSFPSLTSMQDIRDAIAQYDSTALHSRTEGLKRDIELINHKLERTSIVDFYNHFHYITTLHKDLLKLTVLQEEKLKQHLNKELSNLSNKEEIDSLTNWIAAIDKNKEQTLAYFQELSNCLPEIQTFIADKKLRHKRILKDDPTLEKTQEKITVLSAEKNQLMDKIEQKEKNIVIYQVLAVLGILSVPVILLPLAAITLVVIFAPAFILIAIGSTALFALALIIAEKCFNAPYKKLINSIEELVSKPLDDLKGQLTDLNENLEYLEEDVIFMQNYTNWNDNFIPRFGNPNILMSELDSDLSELNQLQSSVELENVPNKKPAKSSVSVSLVSMFGQKESKTPLESDTPSAAVSP